MPPEADRPAAPAGAPWRWHAFSAAPHRLFLWSGVLYAIVSVLLWTVQQASLYAGVWRPLLWPVPHAQAHAFMMIFGVLGFYIFGFLLTTFPRWLDGDPVPRPFYLAAWGLLMVGAHGFWVALLLAPAALLAAVLAVGAGYGVAVAALLRVQLAARGERTQQWYMIAGLLLALLGIAAAAVAVGTGAPEAWRVMTWVGLNGYLLLVVLPVVYRMVPFFTSTVTPDYVLARGRWTLPLFALGIALRGGLGYAGHTGWLWLGDGLLLITLLRELVRWRCWRVKGPPLLLILYMALGWFVVAFALGTGESLYVLLTGAPPPFRNAALHALAVGGLGSLLLGISTRVTLGHSGRGLATSPLVHALFWGYQLVPLTRVLPEVLVPLLSPWVPSAWAVQGYWAGVGWVVVFAVWLARIGPVLLRPRADGRPG